MSKPISSVGSIVPRNIADLVPHPRNPRKHSEAQLTQIAASIKERGFTSPILIDPNNTIIAGVARMLAAQQAGMLTLPCIVLEGLSEAQISSYVIADNKLALNAEWDVEMLVAELGRLADQGCDLDMTGFDQDEMTALAEGVAAEIAELADEMPQPISEEPVGDPSNVERDVSDDRVKDQPSANQPVMNRLVGDKSISHPPPVKQPGGAEPAVAQQHSPNPATAARQPAERHVDAQDAWKKGMPEFNQPEAGPFRTIRVHFIDQAAVDAFAKLLDRKITDDTKSFWYPETTKSKATVVYG